MDMIWIYFFHYSFFPHSTNLSLKIKGYKLINTFEIYWTPWILLGPSDYDPLWCFGPCTPVLDLSFWVLTLFSFVPTLICILVTPFLYIICSFLFSVYVAGTVFAQVVAFLSHSSANQLLSHIQRSYKCTFEICWNVDLKSYHLYLEYELFPCFRDRPLENCNLTNKWSHDVYWASDLPFSWYFVQLDVEGNWCYYFHLFFSFICCNQTISWGY